MNSTLEQISTQAPRDIRIQTWQRFLLQLAGNVQGTSGLSIRLLRMIYGKKLKHMRNTGGSFQLEPSSHPQIWGIYWRGKKLGETVPFPSPLSHSNIWLIATGPSINQYDLTRIGDQPVMGLNGAIAACNKHHIRPAYYTITDRDFFEHRGHLVREAVESGAHCFFSFNGLSRLCQHAPDLLQKGRISLLETVNSYYGIPKLSPSDLRQALLADFEMFCSEAGNPKIAWSGNIAKGVFTACTIAYIGCQIAAHLKAGNIYILGMDLGSGGSFPERSYEQGAEARPTSISKDYSISILPAFQFLSSLDHSAKFWNVSPQSRLPSEIMPKISFEQALTTSRMTE